jgi:hypothetical protein
MNKKKEKLLQVKYDRRVDDYTAVITDDIR